MIPGISSINTFLNINFTQTAYKCPALLANSIIHLGGSVVVGNTGFEWSSVKTFVSDSCIREVLNSSVKDFVSDSCIRDLPTRDSCFDLIELHVM